MKPLNVIISTGPGRLHLFQTAVALKKASVGVTVISGWIPGKLVSDSTIDMLGGFIFGRKNLSEGLRKRTPNELDKRQIKACSLADFFFQALVKLAAVKLLTYEQASVLGWTLYGKQSQKFINNADVFHVRSGAGCGNAIEVAKKKGIKVLVDHSIAHPKEMADQIEKANRRNNSSDNKYVVSDPKDKFWEMVLSDCEKADLLLVNSEYVKDSFLKYGYAANKIRVANLGISESFNSRKSNYEIEGHIKLAFTGAFGNRKGASLIIDAIDMLMRDNIAFSLDIIGSITGDVSIPSWFIEHPKIKFHGHLSHVDMIPILSSCDLYIFPTYVEGSAQSVKEAMSIGLPVITTEKSGSPIEHASNGWLIEDDDELALANAIKTLSNDTVLRTKIGKNASKTIIQYHTWECYAEDVKKVYGELINNRSL